MARKASRTTSESVRSSSRAPLLAPTARGFTIVELLIVIVVIAILAAITAVAYNGIQNRARASAAQSAARQAFSAISTFAAQNSDQYPASAAAAGLSDSGSTSYQYRVDNSTSPRTFCVTATTNNVSYFSSNASSSPAPGACAGHGANGVATITNLAPNPSFESNTDCVGHQQSGVTSSRSTAAATSGQYSLAVNTTGTSNSGFFCNYATVEPGMQYSATVSVRAPAGTPMRMYLSDFISGSYQTESFDAFTATGAWQTMTATRTTTAGTNQLRLGVRNTSTTALTYYVDSMIVVAGSPAAFYDGNSAGWAWNGTPNNSTSTGPLL